MATFIINIENKKYEKVLKAFLDALELDYEVLKKPSIKAQSRPLNEQGK